MTDPNIKANFTYVPAENEMVDAEYVLNSDRRWTVQDCRAYGGFWAVNEGAPEGTPDAEYWMRDWGSYRTLKGAMEACMIRAAIQENEAA